LQCYLSAAEGAHWECDDQCSDLRGGVALMVLPTLVVGNELLILAGGAAAVGLWFLAHRHGRLQGFVDANKNGIDDRLEAGRQVEIS
jgi:hypothetical protein